VNVISCVPEKREPALTVGGLQCTRVSEHHPGALRDPVGHEEAAERVRGTIPCADF